MDTIRQSECDHMYVYLVITTNFIEYPVTGGARNGVGVARNGGEGARNGGEGGYARENRLNHGN